MSDKIKYHVKVFVIGKEEDVAELCELKAKAYNEDSINIVSEETNFTKEGRYLVAVHWIETFDNVSESEELYNAITGDS